MSETNTTMPLVSVVMTNYNGKPYLEKALESVLDSSYQNFELVLVDNASTDGSAEIVKAAEANQKIKAVLLGENYGYSEGNNIGVRHASPEAKYIAILNNDVEVSPAWLSQLIEFMENNPDVGAAQSKVLLMNDRNRIDSAGHFLDRLGYTYVRGEDEEDKGQYESADDISYPYGTAFAIRHDVLKEVSLEEGLFDKEYFCYHEDSDLGLRIWLRGYRVAYVPSSIVYHARGGTGRRYEIQSWVVFHLTRNRFMSLIKNYDKRNIAISIPALLFLELGRALFTLILMPRHSMATVRAILYVLKHFKTIREKRRFVQSAIRRVPDNVVISHFVATDVLYNYHKFRKYVNISKKVTKPAD